MSSEGFEYNVVRGCGQYPTIVSDQAAEESRKEDRQKELDSCPARQILLKGPGPWNWIVQVLDRLHAKNDDYAEVLDQLRALESLDSARLDDLPF